METRKLLLEKLNENVSQLLQLTQNLVDHSIAVYQDWTIKETLGHIMFWHESFARNVRDIVNGVQPTPLKGTYRELNTRCFDETRDQPVQSILARLAAAHKIIQGNILKPQLELIPYKKGSRSYSPEEHLQIVAEHIGAHFKDIKMALHHAG